MKTVLLFIISVFSLSLFAQSGLYKPKEIKRAYDKGTRSTTGVPGENYWQNYAFYKIKANINPETKLLTGSETIEYSNNSPDTLKSLVIKLNQNMNKKEALHFMQLSEDAITDGMHLTNIVYNGTGLSLDPAAKQTIFQGANLILRLPVPLPPKQKADIEFDWSFTIPGSSNIRMGAYDSVSFFIGYWYPKIAVYDDINGWDLHPYEGAHEFYQEYADYNVTVTVPHGFFVWSTGMLQNPGIMNKQVAGRYESALKSDSIIHIITEDDLKSGGVFPTKSAVINWNYNARNVPDFAFGVSNSYLWDAASVEVEPGRRVLVQAAYNPKSEFFRKSSVSTARRSIEFFSKTMPGVPYPYPSITVYNGDGGMEFPMIVNDGDFGNAVTDVYVTAHEIAHMYFPFMVGTNETRYAFMDEGMAYFLPLIVQQELSNYNHIIRAAKGYGSYAGKESDYPMMIPSTASIDPDLSMLTYYKPALSYSALQSAMGEELFSKALKEFINRWESKHPLPYDFFYTFESVAGENMDWFWKPWYFERAVPDLAIEEVNFGGGKVTYTVVNKGGMPVPVKIKYILDDGNEIKEDMAASVWKDKDRIKVNKSIDGNVKRIEIGAPEVPDADLTNNIYSGGN